MRNQRMWATPLVLALGLGMGCEGGEQLGDAPPPVVIFGTGTVRIETAADTFQLQAEIAERPDQRTHGLMERRSLPEDAGMIFLYDGVQDGGAGFYMFRTRIPLDIAFMDEDGRIVAIKAMEPCASPNPQWCPTYSPGVPYASALEVNRGYFAGRGIEVGDHVVLVRNGVAGPP